MRGAAACVAPRRVWRHCVTGAAACMAPHLWQIVEHPRQLLCKPGEQQRIRGGRHWEKVEIADHSGGVRVLGMPKRHLRIRKRARVRLRAPQPIAPVANGGDHGGGARTQIAEKLEEAVSASVELGRRAENLLGETCPLLLVGGQR